MLLNLQIVLCWFCECLSLIPLWFTESLRLEKFPSHSSPFFIEPWDILTILYIYIFIILVTCQLSQSQWNPGHNNIYIYIYIYIYIKLCFRYEETEFYFLSVYIYTFFLISNFVGYIQFHFLIFSSGIFVYLMGDQNHHEGTKLILDILQQPKLNKQVKPSLLSFVQPLTFIDFWDTIKSFLDIFSEKLYYKRSKYSKWYTVLKTCLAWNIFWKSLF